MRKTNLVFIIAFVLLVYPAVSNARDNNTDEQKKDEKVAKVVKADIATTTATSTTATTTTTTATSTTVTSTVTTTDDEDNSSSARAEERRSRVATAVQELVHVADRVGGIGQQVKVIAQEQKTIQEEAEVEVEALSDRSKIMKFFIGPDYAKIKSAEDKMIAYEEALQNLKDSKIGITSTTTVSEIDAQITVIEDVMNELNTEIENSSKGFSLFGWLNKILSK